MCVLHTTRRELARLLVPNHGARERDSQNNRYSEREDLAGVARRVPLKFRQAPVRATNFGQTFRAN